MKTEQEQIEQIMCMFNKLRRGDYCVNNCYGCCGDEKIDITCHDVVVNFIQALMQAGYGDVSEYKAEIEQLKAKNKVLGDGVVKAFTNGFNTGREQVEKDIRRAKINILNKLKENAIEIGIDTSEFNNIEFVEVDTIDELIKEVENEN